MENYIMINGVRLELTTEQVAALTAATDNKRNDPFERMPGDEYYFVYGDGDVCVRSDTNDPDASDLFDVANYCRDKELMEQRTLHETLNRLLWRYSEQHGGDPEWDLINEHWYITYCAKGGYFDVGCVHGSKEFGIYFPTREVAESAIKEIAEPFMADHPEFVW